MTMIRMTGHQLQEQLAFVSHLGMHPTSANRISNSRHSLTTFALFGGIVACPTTDRVPHRAMSASTRSLCRGPVRQPWTGTLWQQKALRGACSREGALVGPIY